MNSKNIKIILAVVLLVAAALLIFRFVSGGGGAPATGVDGQPNVDLPVQ